MIVYFYLSISDANVDLDAILNDLESLTQMLKSELKPEPSSNDKAKVQQQQQQQQQQHHHNLQQTRSPTLSLPRSTSGDSGHCCQGSQATILPAFNNVELRRKPTTVSPTKGVVVEVHHQHQHHHVHSQEHESWSSSDFISHHRHQTSPPQNGSNRASMGDSDSAFSESGSTPTNGASGGSSGSVANQHPSPNAEPDEKLAKEEKIRVALEKIREAQIRKLCIRIFGPDETTSKTLFIDETTTVRQVIHLLTAKNHVEPNPSWSVVEYFPDLYCQRVLEDHESLVSNMLQWKPDSPNSVRFEMRSEKYDLFARPEQYLTESEAPMDHSQRLQLVQECFSDISVRFPHLEMNLYLKHPSKKSWKKLTFFMRGSGLYYSTKSKGKCSAKDLVCLAQFEHVNVYTGTHDFQKKFKAPTPYGFVLKHPQLQKRCKYVHYLCADSSHDLKKWCMSIRLAKYGRQLAENYATLSQDIASWPSERGLSAAGLLQKVTGVTAPVVTPLRHSFTPSIGSTATTLTDGDRSTPSQSAAARMATSAEQLVLNGSVQRQEQEHGNSLSKQGSKSQKHIRFQDDSKSDTKPEVEPCYDNASKVVFPPPPPLLCHDYDTICEEQMAHSEAYGIIVKPPVPAKPRHLMSPTQSGEIGEGPELPPRNSTRTLAEISGELDKLLSARAARLEKLWAHDESTEDLPPPNSMLLVSQELSSEDTGTIKKRPPPPPRRSDVQSPNQLAHLHQQQF